MFDIGFWEVSLIAIIALMVLGPERLPRVARTAGMWAGKMKRMVADVKTSIDEELRMEDLKAIKQAGEDLKDGLQSTQDELKVAGGQFQKSVEEAAEETEAKVDIAAAISQSAPKPADDSSSASLVPADRSVAEKSTEKKTAKQQDYKKKAAKKDNKKKAAKKDNKKKAAKKDVEKVGKKGGKKTAVSGNGASRKAATQKTVVKAAAGKKKKSAKKDAPAKDVRQGTR